MCWVEESKGIYQTTFIFSKVNLEQQANKAIIRRKPTKNPSYLALNYKLKARYQVSDNFQNFVFRFPIGSSGWISLFLDVKGDPFTQHQQIKYSFHMLREDKENKSVEINMKPAIKSFQRRIVRITPLFKTLLKHLVPK